MLTIDCPLCAGPAHTDEALAIVTCEACDLVAEVAPDPAIRLDVAA
jgi:hypothetical protein